MRLTRVDLPDPDGPITASHPPGATRRETSSSARTATLVWYTRLTFLSSIGIILLAGSLRAVSVAIVLAERWRRSAPGARCQAIPEAEAKVAAGWRHQSWLCQSKKQFRCPERILQRRRLRRAGQLPRQKKILPRDLRLLGPSSRQSHGGALEPNW